MDNNKVAFPSIFDTAVESEKEFDNMFGGEEDCDLMDAVCGFKEDGSVIPDDEATPKDIKDELGENHDTDNTPKCDSSEADVLNDKEGNNVSCPDCGVEDSESGDATKKVDPENIEDEADKAAETFDEAYNALMREAAEDLGEEVPAAEETPDVETPDVTEEGKGCEDCKEGSEEVEDEDLVSDLVDDDDTEDVDDDIEDEEESADIIDNSDVAGDPPSDEEDETVKEDATLPVDSDEEDLINAVEDETKEDEPSVDEIEKELNTDEDEDLIDIVAGSEEAE